MSGYNAVCCQELHRAMYTHTHHKCRAKITHLLYTMRPLNPTQHMQPSFIITHHAVPGTHRYSSIKSLWNFVIRPTHSVPGARKVVRKCKVPSFCPNPEPGTIHMPVFSSNRMQ